MENYRKNNLYNSFEKCGADFCVYRLMFDLFIINGEEAEPWVPLIYPPTDVRDNCS